MKSDGESKWIIIGLVCIAICFCSAIISSFFFDEITEQSDEQEIGIEEMLEEEIAE